VTAAAGEIRCQRCLDGYSLHQPDGPCTAIKGEHERIPCLCPGFRWVAVDGPAVGSYREPPQRPSAE
jgi:hypothetical protein